MITLISCFHANSSSLLFVGKYYGMDHDSFEDAVTTECRQTSEAGELNAATDEGEKADKIYDEQTTYNPFDIHMGQMTVYRLHISCTCSESSLRSKAGGGNKRRCGKILEDQPWSGYMGSHADSHFPYRTTTRAPTPKPVTSKSV